ncbi:MAG: putative exosortase B-associated extracellular polysaccharide biosynthesis transporter EpsL, partial [Nitrosomonadaceae bacterium]
AATSFASRSDTLQSGLIALDWQPVNALFLSATLQHDRRSSNLTGFDFTSSAASVTARVNF